MAGLLRFRISNFLGGLNEQNRADLIADNELQKIANYMVTEDGSLEKRDDAVPIVNGLPAEIRDLMFKIWVWYPDFLPDDSDKKYLLLIYTEEEELWLLRYTETTDEWVSVYQDETPADAPLFRGLWIPTISKTTDGLVLVDGRENNTVKFIRINQYNQLRFGDVGLPAPLSIAVLNLDDANNNYASDDSTDIGMAIRRGANLFMTYTMVTEDGIESNPAPISVSTSLNYLKRDENFQVTDYWQRALYEGIRTYMADVVSHNPALRDTVKYFNIYLSYSMFTESIFPRQDIRRALRIPISDILGSNNYISTTPPTGQLLSYDNDVGVKGDDVCHTGGVTFIANSNRAIQFPFKFENYLEIRLSNQNSRNYVDGNFWIRVSYSDLVDRDGDPVIANDAGLANLIANHKIRIYDVDQTTPLPVLYAIYSGAYFDILVKIPYLPAQQRHTVYLVCGGDGVPIAEPGETDFRTAAYGDWQLISALWDEQIIITGVRVRSSNTMLSTSHEVYESDKISNRVDINKPLNFTGDVSFISIIDITSFRIFGLVYPYAIPSTGSLNAIRTIDDGLITQDSEEPTLVPFPEMGYFTFAFATTATTASTKIFSIQYSSTRYILIRRNYIDANNCQYVVTVRNGDVLTRMTDPLDVFQPNAYTLRLFVSWNREAEKVYLSAVLRDGTFVGAESDIDMDAFPVDPSYYFMMTSLPGGAIYHYYAQLFSERGEYVNTELNVRQITSHLPYFPEEWIGYHEGDAENKNIEIIPAEKIAFNSRMGILQFSSLGGLTFPSLNFVRVQGRIIRVIPAPNFLKDGSYLNCILIFGEDYRQRLLLSGTPEGWQANLNEVLIDEKVYYGLSEKSKETLIMVGDTLYWLSGNKFIQENMNGMRILNIENGIEKVKIDYPPDGQRYLTFYEPKNNKIYLCLTEYREPTGESPVTPKEWTGVTGYKGWVYFDFKFNVDTMVSIDFGDGVKIKSSYTAGILRTVEHRYTYDGTKIIKFVSEDWDELLELRGDAHFDKITLIKEFVKMEKIDFSMNFFLSDIITFPEWIRLKYAYWQDNFIPTTLIDKIFTDASFTTRTGGAIDTRNYFNGAVTSASLSARNTLIGKGFTLHYEV